MLAASAKRAVHGMRNFQFRPLRSYEFAADGSNAWPANPSRLGLHLSQQRSFCAISRSIVSRMSRCLLAAALLILSCACAHETAASASADTFRPSSLAEQPDLTSGEVSRRFLKFLGSLRNLSDLSPAAVSEGLGVSLKRTASGGYAFRMVLRDSGWSYGIDFLESTGLKRKTFSLDFANDRRDRSWGQVCEVSLSDAVSALERAGFAGGPEYGEIGQLQGYAFGRGDVYVLIRVGAAPASRDGAVTKACFESISVHAAG